MLSTGEEIRSPQRSSRSGPILAKMPCTKCTFWDKTCLHLEGFFDLNFIQISGRYFILSIPGSQICHSQALEMKTSPCCYIPLIRITARYFWY